MEHFNMERRKNNGTDSLKHRGKVKGREAVSGEVSQNLKLKSLKALRVAKKFRYDHF